ncbi:MAG: hypothetical protein FWH21_01730 [Kiritimatiellaeota bacterium]|nr:hypothetical protein [Kiritimatiellota bacterium]
MKIKIKNRMCFLTLAAAAIALTDAGDPIGVLITSIRVDPASGDVTLTWGGPLSVGTTTLIVHGTDDLTLPRSTWMRLDLTPTPPLAPRPSPSWALTSTTSSSPSPPNRKGGGNKGTGDWERFAAPF